MPLIRTAAEDMPLGERLLGGLRYPLRGGALPTCIVLGLCHYAALLPSIIGLFAVLGVWIATWRYAIDCLVLTADGHEDAPEVRLEARAGNPRGILLLHIVLALACIVVAVQAPTRLWLVLTAAALLLPAIDMSLAFDGDMLVALNPLTWLQIVARFGGVYLVPVFANVVLVLTILLVRDGFARLPAVLSLPLFGFVASYLVVLDFHWMGVLVWHCRDRLGMTPEAPEIAARLGHNADEQLLAECAALAHDQPEEAAIRLRDRIRDSLAPAVVHTRFRELLRRLQRKDLLLKHGQDWIVQLCASGDERRALGVVHECRELDPGFVPNDPAHTAQLAKAAARIGMHELAWYLASSFMRRWPQHADAADLKLLAAPRGSNA